MHVKNFKLCPSILEWIFFMNEILYNHKKKRSTTTKKNLNESHKHDVKQSG